MSQNETKKMGRPRKPESEKHMVPTMVKLQPKLRHKLDQLAKQNNMTLSAYLRAIFEERVCFEEAA